MKKKKKIITFKLYKIKNFKIKNIIEPKKYFKIKKKKKKKKKVNSYFLLFYFHLSYI
jgi:hypothetical protein